MRVGAWLFQKNQGFKALYGLHLGIESLGTFLVWERNIYIIFIYIYMYLHILANVHTHIEVISY